MLFRVFHQINCIGRVVVDLTVFPLEVLLEALTLGVGTHVLFTNRAHNLHGAGYKPVLSLLRAGVCLEGIPAVCGQMIADIFGAIAEGLLVVVPIDRILDQEPALVGPASVYLTLFIFCADVRHGRDVNRMDARPDCEGTYTSAAAYADVAVALSVVSRAHVLLVG